MASELRVNSSTNRSGLGTITYTDSGPIVSGVGTFANGLTVDGTQTTVKSLKLTGDNYNANWFKTTNKLRFNDNAKATFGTADDLSIYHDGGNTRINNATGILNIQSDDFQITDASNTTTRFRVDADGPTYLRYNGSNKFETSNTGVTITGTAVAGGLDISGDIDVDGHTNLDNVSIAGVTTITGSGNALEIVGGLVRSRNTASARFVANNGSAEGYFGWSSGVLTVGQAAATLSLEATGSNHIQLKTNGSERLRINNLGAVLVGGTLQAGSNGGLNAEVTSSGNQTTAFALINQGTADGSGVIISHRGKDDAGNQQDYNYIRMVADDTGNGSEDGSIRFWTLNGGTLGERVRITSGGQVCIGTDTAVRALTIKQPGQIHLESTDTGNWLGVSLKGSSGTNNYNAYFGLLDSNGDFFIDNGSNGNDFVITQSGQVNIGISGSLKAEINNSVGGHYFVSQCDDNQNGFEIYQQHGATNTRAAFAVYDNKTGSKDLSFKIDGAGWTYHNTTSNGTTNGNVDKRYNFGSTNNSNMAFHLTTRQRYSIWEHRQIGRTQPRTAQMSTGENPNNQGTVIMYSSTANADVTGGVNLTNGATSWSGNSDMRLKNKTGDILNALEDINKIEPLKFTLKYGPDNNPHVGVSAQSVENVVPEAIDRGVDVERQREGDETEYMKVRYTELIPLSIAAIKELKAEVESLKAEVAALKGS